MKRNLGQAEDLDRPPAQAAVDAFYAAMKPYWHPVLRASALREDQPNAIRLLGTEVVLVRLDGEVCALRNACRHFQAPLSLGRVTEVNGQQCLQCPYHGWAYGADGRCTRIPQLAPGKSIPQSAAVPRYAVKIAYGVIWVCLAEAPRFELPAYPEFSDPTFRTVELDEVGATAASAPRMILGTLDDTHFPWIHEGILGTQDQPAPPDHTVERQGSVLRVQYEISQPPNQATTDVSRSSGDDQALVALSYTNYVSMPNAIRLVKDSDAGCYVIWLATCPSDYNETVNFWAFSRNYDLAPVRDQDYIEFSQTVRDQDKPVIEGQRPVLVPPLCSGLSLAMSPADEPLIEYLRWLEELGITSAPTLAD
jgi:phenylpropionate dioxygenase-like ring-hydroxylating dioxygenase large terminal subunit